MTQPRPRSTSWEVRVAAVMVGAGVLLGAGLVALSVRMFTMDPGFLFAIMPIVVSFVLGAGLYIALGSVMLVVSLHRRTRTARLRTVLLGVISAGCGLTALVSWPWMGFALALYGGILVWLMLMPGAAADLGPWKRAFGQPEPWGRRPGRGIWSAQPPKRGPWSPDGTTLSRMPRRQGSGPQTPWWEVWRAALDKGIPRWEALVIGALLLVFFVSLAAILVGARLVGLLGVGVAIAGVVPVEQRMRERVAGRR